MCEQSRHLILSFEAGWQMAAGNPVAAGKPARIILNLRFLYILSGLFA